MGYVARGGQQDMTLNLEGLADVFLKVALSMAPRGAPGHDRKCRESNR